jgi:PelA/Pel-15E family pectate lyase
VSLPIGFFNLSPFDTPTLGRITSPTVTPWNQRPAPKLLAAALLAASCSLTHLAAATQVRPAPAPPQRRQVLDAMKRATTFMVEKVATRGGYVWQYLADFSRRWGEIEARPTMIWLQPPGTPTMGHLFLDAYHATNDELYYRAAERAALAIVAAQLPCGGWNYVADFAGERPLQEWYDTVGRNAWRLEEFQHNWRNATYDDGGTADSAELLLRMYLEKHDPRFKQALDKALSLVLDSQYPVGAWPQRYPLKHEFVHHGKPDYTSFLTFNDDVTAGNVEFLLKCYQALGDSRLREPILRGMRSFLAVQQKAPQAGWALQYTPDLVPAGARAYEPTALVTHTTAANVEQLLRFYRLTGDERFLTRVPEAIDWLDSVKLPPDVAALAPGRTHPTFVEVGTNQPLYVHRRGSNVVNGEYFVDRDPHKTIGHYNSFRQIDVEKLRREYGEARALSPADLAKASPLQEGSHEAPAPARTSLPRYFAVGQLDPVGPPDTSSRALRAARAIANLDPQGRWLTDLTMTSHPYRGNGPDRPPPGDFSQTQVGDDSDTSPYRGEPVRGISTSAYIRNMSDLIRYLDATR